MDSRYNKRDLIGNFASVGAESNGRTPYPRESILPPPAAYKGQRAVLGPPTPSYPEDSTIPDPAVQPFQSTIPGFLSDELSINPPQSIRAYGQQPEARHSSPYRNVSNPAISHPSSRNVLIPQTHPPPSFKRQDIRPTEPPGPFSCLKDFDTILLIDDSEYVTQHWDRVNALVLQIAEVCVKHDRDGIDLFFINHRPGWSLYRSIERSGYRNIDAVHGNLTQSKHGTVDVILKRVKPKGPCMLGDRLTALLYWYMSQLGRHQQEKGDKSFTTKLNLIIITAGIEGGKDGTSARIIAKVAKRLDDLNAPLDQVGVQIIQVGKNRSARREFERIDNELYQEKGTRDIADTISWDNDNNRPMSQTELRKAILGGFSKIWDARNP